MMAHQTQRNSSARLHPIEIGSSILGRKTVARVRLAMPVYVEHAGSTWRFLIATMPGTPPAWLRRLNWRLAGNHHAISFIPTYCFTPTQSSGATGSPRQVDHALPQKRRFVVSQSHTEVGFHTPRYARPSAP